MRFHCFLSPLFSSLMPLFRHIIFIDIADIIIFAIAIIFISFFDLFAPAIAIAAFAIAIIDIIILRHTPCFFARRRWLAEFSAISLPLIHY
jgi:membrane protein YdbS with pleckstrin-like domain